MTLTDTDRHRFVAAAVLTLLALPALWWANTSDNSAGPNLAVAGIDADTELAVAVSANAQPAAAPSDPIGDATPSFLEGPTSAVGAGRAVIAVPARPLLDGITANATFRSTISRSACIVSGPTAGSTITIVNLANNRSVTCTAVLTPNSVHGEVVMHTNAFASIADLTDAPISVEIRR